MDGMRDAYLALYDSALYCAEISQPAVAVHKVIDNGNVYWIIGVVTIAWLYLLWETEM